MIMKSRRIRQATAATVIAVIAGLGFAATPAPAQPYCAFLNDISDIQARRMQNATNIGDQIHWFSLWLETQQDLEGGNC
jgi:hypothetical protein